MDKIAVISDVHGNLPALEAVLDDIRGRGIDLIYNLGDLVGKGARSDLAVDRCREVCAATVRGNWDEFMTHVSDHPMNLWVQAQLGAERLAYLRDLPNVIDFWLSGKRVRLYHASQVSVDVRVYRAADEETHRAMFTNTPFTGFDEREPEIVGYGDIHEAYMRTLMLDHKILFNAGSVGNPLDLPLASYVILTGALDKREPAPFSVDFVRVPYDIEREIEEARRGGAPDLDVYAVELRTAVYRRRQKQATETALVGKKPRIKARLSIGYRSTEFTVFQDEVVVWRGDFQFWAVDWIYKLVTYMRTVHNLLIGTATAERILFEIGSLAPLPQERMMSVKGRNLVTGMPTIVEISTIEVREVLGDIQALTWQIANILKTLMLPEGITQYPPPVPLEFRDALRQQPIELTGDFGSIRGLDEQIKTATGLNVIAIDKK